ncbi:MAG: amidohydrolase family protein [Desulfuromonadaceae bacterium]|nr:amidohydrolase family protein [Desulfuromonadaceae bacterium]
MNIVQSMDKYAVVTDTYFDGEKHHTSGPYTVVVEKGSITGIVKCDFSDDMIKKGISVKKTKFLMPGLVEAHSHLFLDGGQLDFTARNEYLNASGEEMLTVARANIAANLAAGVTLVVDAGDRYGVNHDIRLESGSVTVRSAGWALRRPGRYGSFMAREVGNRDEIAAAVREIGKDADDLKVILTGIIDFKAGLVKGEPQFDAEELRFIVTMARELGLRTFVHCSGLAGLAAAVAAGVDSIEHGFFMNRDILKAMADQGIAWVPTFSPVYFQWQRPEIAGWDVTTVAHLRRIIDAHFEHVAMAADLGVPLVAGSDAGSNGVRHGEALIDELDCFSWAGLPMEAVLRSATSLPRTRWGVDAAMLAVGQVADFITLAGSPFDDARYLHQVTVVCNRSTISSFPRGRMDEPASQNKIAVGQ